MGKGGFARWGAPLSVYCNGCRRCTASRVAEERRGIIISADNKGSELTKGEKGNSLVGKGANNLVHNEHNRNEQ